MLGSKLHSGTSKTKAGRGGLVRVALFGSLTVQLGFSMRDFVPCDRIVHRPIDLTCDVLQIDRVQHRFAKRAKAIQYNLFLRKEVEVRVQF